MFIDDTVNTGTVDDNQGALNTVVDPAAGGEPSAVDPKQQIDQTSPETAEPKPEFSDPNMHARFTQKMTELKQKEDELKSFESKIKAFDFLSQDPKFKEWYNGIYKQAASPAEFRAPELTDEEFYAATTSREAFQQVMNKQILAAIEHLTKNAFEPRLQEIQQNLKVKEILQEIQDFSATTNEKGELKYPDFWQLDEKGLLEPVLSVLAHIPETVATSAQKLEWAYMLAKYPEMGKQAIAKAHDLTQAKKKAIGEKGTGSNNLSSKKLTTREFAEKTAQELGIE